MTWSRVDDGLHTHVKTMRAGLEAMGLWVLCMSYCGFHENDGIIEAEVAARLAEGAERAQSLAARLVAAGLWERLDDGSGWRFHDWHKYNPSARQLAIERRKKAEAGRKGGLSNAKRWESTREAPAKQVPSKREARASSPLPLLESPRPDPTRPDPDQDPPIAPHGGRRKDDRVDRVFAHWLKVRQDHGKPGSPKLDDKRRRAILDRLGEGYSAEDLCRAIDGLFRSPHHLGQNDRETEYLDVWHALRSAKHVDGFIERVGTGVAPPEYREPPVEDALTGDERARAAEKVLEELANAKNVNKTPKPPLGVSTETRDGGR